MSDIDANIAMDMAKHAAQEALVRMADVLSTMDGTNKQKLMASAYASAIVIAKLEAARYTQPGPELGELTDSLLGELRPQFKADAQTFHSERPAE